MDDNTPEQPRRKAGRPKGSKNRRGELFEKATAMGADPFEFMAKLINARDPGFRMGDKGITMSLRFDASKELAQYIRPKLKAIEHSTGEGEGISLLVGGVLPMMPAGEDDNHGKRNSEEAEPGTTNSEPSGPTGGESSSEGPSW